MGRLTRDVELRHTQSQTPVASFTLAVNRMKKDDPADFIDCVAWRSTAEFVSKYFTKGMMCAVVGRLQIRDWTDKDGNKRRLAEVIADNVYFTESKKSERRGVDVEGPGYQAPTNGSDFAELDMDDGELPFENGL